MEMDADAEDTRSTQLTETVEGDALEYDESAYIMYHRAQTGVKMRRYIIIGDT